MPLSIISRIVSKSSLAPFSQASACLFIQNFSFVIDFFEKGILIIPNNCVLSFSINEQVYGYFLANVVDASTNQKLILHFFFIILRTVFISRTTRRSMSAALAGSVSAADPNKITL